ncbi:hypothetical protein [Streptomyces sp. NPDC050504]|uniref:hypothetical protein n=1 Tax=Streptomyces sp. NPDC050504 TaxID=3365618 RepID=UPI0037BA86CC
MDKHIVVKGDAVTGTDTHNVAGVLEADPTKAYAGKGKYAYKGAVTEHLSAFVTIGGVPVALTSSGSTLDAGETASGGHFGPNGSQFLPPGPSAPSLTVTDEVGPGKPGTSAGSGLLTVGGVRVLLDGDPFDTCSGVPAPGVSKVTAGGQSFVRCTK